MNRVLILGGTAWLGGRIAREWQGAGAEVTCLARGEAGSVPDGATLVRTDRAESGAYDAVADAEWDEVVELSWDPAFVEGALAALAPAARHWSLVSSVSVYAGADAIDADESAELLVPDDPSDYGRAKVAAERASTAALGDRLLIVRPGLIAGPGDGSDRFGYWPARFALAGDGPVLVPPRRDGWVQVIDVADLAAFVVSAGGAARTGAVDAVGRSVTLGEALAMAADVGGFAGEIVEASAAELVDADVAHWSGPRSLPLWVPAEMTGFSRRSHATYDRMGGRLRALRDTLERTLEDERSRGLDRDRRSGLSRPDELEVLAGLSARTGDETRR